MTEKGILGLRDSDGQLKRVEYRYTYNAFDVDITFDPPPGDVLDEMQTISEEDVSYERVHNWVDTYIIEPEIPDDEPYTLPELITFIRGMIRWSNGIPSGFDDDEEETRDEQRQAAIDERTNGSEGN